MLIFRNVLVWWEKLSQRKPLAVSIFVDILVELTNTETAAKYKKPDPNNSSYSSYTYICSNLNVVINGNFSSLAGKTVGVY